LFSFHHFVSIDAVKAAPAATRVNPNPTRKHHAMLSGMQQTGAERGGLSRGRHKPAD